MYVKKRKAGNLKQKENDEEKKETFMRMKFNLLSNCWQNKVMYYIFVT